MVLFPDPETPTNPIFAPAGIKRLMFETVCSSFLLFSSSLSLSSSSSLVDLRYGYAKLTFLNSIFPANYQLFFHFHLHLCLA